MGNRWCGRIFLRCVCVAMALVIFGAHGGEAAQRRVSVGVVTAGDFLVLDVFLAGLQEELAHLAGPDLEVVAPGTLVRKGLGTEEGMEQVFRGVESDSGISLGLSLGYVASGVAARRGHWEKPMLATHLLEPPSRRHSLFHVIVVGPLVRMGVAQFVDAIPLDSVTLVVDDQARLILSDIEAFAGHLAPLKGKTVTVKMVASNADSLLDAISSERGGVIFTPFPSLSQADVAEVAQGLIQKRLPSYAMGGRGHVEAGMLFTSEPGGAVRKLARRTALSLYSMARNETLDLDAETRGWGVKGTPVINMATARQIGFSPRPEVMRDAVTLGDVPVEMTPLSLAEAMTRACLYNTELASEARLVEARGEDVNRALAHLIPHLGASVSGIRIDENSAEKSRGTESEESIKGSLTLTQVLYSEKAWSGYSALKKVQRSREAEQRARELDTALAAGEAYISLLKVRSLATVREGNLSLTRQNLARARARKLAGTLNPSELFRWESEVAENRTSLLGTRAQVFFAENALKRLCGIPFGERVAVGGGDDHALLLSSRPEFQKMMTGMDGFNDRVATLVSVGWDASPERLQIDHALDAGRRRLKGTKRAFYLPEVALEGTVTEVLDRHGFDQVLPSYDEREWHVAIQAKFPLITGGERGADLRQVAGETTSLSLKRRHLMARLAEKMMDSALAVQVAQLTIDLTTTSRRAAEKNLALVTDAYAEGAVPVITLLDAQNTTVSARIASENAVFDFMVSVLRMQRLLGKVDLSGTAGDEMMATLMR